MTPSLTLIPSTRRAAVKVVATDPSATASKDGRLIRSDANGMATVRRVSGQALDIGPMVIEDSEAAITGDITYTLTGADGQTVTATTTLDGAPDWIAPVQLPQYGTPLLLVSELELLAESQTQVHWVIDREDPIIKLGPLQNGSGPCAIVCQTYRDAEAVERACKHGVVMVRTAEPGADRYAAPQSVQIIREPETGLWLVRLDAVTIPRPDGPQLGSLDWSLDALASLYPTLDDLALAFPTIADVEVGPWTN